MNTRTPRYKVAATMMQMCGLLGVSMDGVLRRAGLPPSAADETTRGVTAVEYFNGWNALAQEAARDDLPLFLGQGYARGHFNPAFFAFTCSPTVRMGLERLAAFKPLTGPVVMHLHDDETGLHILKSANQATLVLPVTYSATEMVFFIEATRNSTGRPVVPKTVTLTERLSCHAALEDFFQTDVGIGPRPSITLNREDAALPLLSRNAAQWAAMEPEFQRQLSQIADDTAMSARLCALLMEMLPAGQSAISQAAARMHVSIRSLQRHLAQENVTYQKILDETRRDLALHYLRTTTLNTEEISCLLAYRDPNSFYRAFHSWTRMTPGQARLTPQSNGPDAFLRPA